MGDKRCRLVNFPEEWDVPINKLTALVSAIEEHTVSPVVVTYRTLSNDGSGKWDISVAFGPPDRDKCREEFYKNYEIINGKVYAKNT